METVPLLSVIVPAYNNSAELYRCLMALRQSDMISRCEILVIDDGSDRAEGQRIEAATLELHGRYQRQENAGPGVARNRGANLARGTILVFIDADCVAPPEWISVITQPLRDGRYAAVTSCYSEPVTSTWLTIFQNEDYRYRMPRTECETSFVNSCNLAILRDVFMNCSGFPEQRVSEDFVLGMKLAGSGTPARYLPDAGIRHDYRRDLLLYLKQRFSFAYNTIRSSVDRDSRPVPQANSQARSFNPVRTALGAMLAFLSAFCLVGAGIAVLFKSPLAGYLLVVALAGLILEAATHARFLDVLRRRQGFWRTLSYLLLIYLVDLTYALAIVRGIRPVMQRLFSSRRVGERRTFTDPVP